MRKHKTIIIGAICALMNTNTANAIAVINPDIVTPTRCWHTPIACTTPDSSCSYICNLCTDRTGSTNSYGIVATDKRSVSTSCTDSTYHSCTCNTTETTYACAAGYYGTATSSSAGCTACPDNATCAGGNGSTFICNSGYVKLNSNPTVCTKCPDNANCAFGLITCNAGYYLDGDTCNLCPPYSLPPDGLMPGLLAPGKSAMGSKAITDCYLPSGTDFSDDTGIGTYGADCYYE